MVVCSIWSIHIGAQSSARLESMRFIKEGDNFLKMGNWNDAMASYGSAVTADPSYADAYMKRAMLNERLGAHMEAEADYGRAVALNPYSVCIFDQRCKLDMLAIEYFSSGGTEDISKNAQPIQLDQDADYFVNIGAYKEAMVIIDSLISIGFERDFEYTKKALVYLLQDDFISCEEFADSALMLSNQSALAHDLKGLSQLKRGKFTESISSFSEAIGIDPSFSVAYLNRAMAHLRIGNNDAAMADLKSSIEMNQEAALAYYMQGTLYSQQGNMSKSLMSYNSALALDSSYSKALFNRSFTWKMMGDFSSAMQDATLIVQIDPESPEYWNLKGNLHLL